MWPQTGRPLYTESPNRWWTGCEKYVLPWLPAKSPINTINMKARTLFIVGVLTIITLSDLSAQLSGQALTDSLLKQLPQAREDTNKVKLLVKIAKSYKQTDISKGFKFAQQALEISRNLDHYFSLQRSFEVLATLSIAQGKFGDAFTYDSLWI